MENDLIDEGLSLNLTIVPVNSDKRIYGYFNGCFIPFYEYLFTRLSLRLPFNELEVGVLKHLKIVSFQLHLNAWDL